VTVTNETTIAALRQVVASAFREALIDYRDAFAEVVFAIAVGPGANLDTFTAAFRSTS
jgi:hypothetical protein